MYLCSPGAVNLREAFEVGYTVHREEEEGKHRNNLKQGHRAAALVNGLNALHSDNFAKEGEEYGDGNAILAKGLKATTMALDVYAVGPRNTNLNAKTAPQRRRQQKGYEQHSAAVMAAAK